MKNLKIKKCNILNGFVQKAKLELIGHLFEVCLIYK